MNLGPHELDNIITGDARQTALPDESIGVILTSPPYNVGLRYEGFEDRLSPDEHKEFNRRWLVEAYRIAQDGCRLYVIVSDEMLWWMRPLAEEIGWRWGQALTWCKPNLCGRSGYSARISNDWNYMSEFILLFRKGKRSPMLSNSLACTFNWFIETVPQRNYSGGRIHPAQLPVSLCLKILARTPGEPVLDPFAGSGSVLVAAKMLGRRYLGFELVPQVAEAARRRLTETSYPLPLRLEQQSATMFGEISPT